MRSARFIYTVLLYILTPVIFLRLLWRSRKLPAYRQRWPERFGYSSLHLQDSIWLHAVSVGETLAAAPLVDALLTRYPHSSIVITTTTPTGSEQVQRLWGERVAHVYLPYDLPGAVYRFLDRARPCLGIIMETELWPNIVAACHRRDIPVVLANARLSERSARGYRRIAALTGEILKNLTVIAVQAQTDAQRFIALGAMPSHVKIVGNIKFDSKFPADLQLQAQALRAQWGAARPVWIAASTHAQEEEQVLAAYARIYQQLPDTLLVLVPRHPDRFREVENLCLKSGFMLKKRSSQQPWPAEVNIYLADTMGELPLLYAASDVAFVGGSLVPTGGHNVLEAAAQGVPVIFGPHMFNFSLISQQLLDAGAAKCVANEEELSQAVIAWLLDPCTCNQAGSAGRRLVEVNQGALERLLHIIGSLIKSR